MTTSRIPNVYYAPDEFVYNNNTARVVPPKNHSSAGVITKKSRKGNYNIVEKDFGDHKVIYHIPREYGDDYDISQIEEAPIVEEQQQHNSPQLVRRRIYQQYDDVDYDDEYEYVEEVPIRSSRRRVYVSPRRSTRDTQVIQRIYEQPPTETVEYVYEDDYPDEYSYRPEREEEVEYVVRERVPKQIYMEEPRPPRRTVYVEEPPAPHLSPRPPPPPPASYSPRRSPHNAVVPHQPSPRTVVNQRSPSPIPVKSNRRNDLSPPPSNRKQQIVRSPTYETPNRSNIPNSNEPPPLRLMDIIAENRAKRGGRIPKPRREIDEENVYDPPTYNRNLIKNGFIVHK